MGGRLDSAANLARVIDRVLALDTRPDCVLLTGDLTDRGEPDAYAVLRETLSRLPMPIYAIPGNHDSRETMRQAFADRAWMPTGPGSRISYEVDLGAFRLLALDSLVEGKDYGMLGVDQLDWLRQRLAAARTARVLLMVHHPPINSGVAVMDAMKLRDAAAFGDIVAAHPNIERILCGHMHRSMHSRWRGTVVSIPFSTVEQIHLGFAPDAPLGTIAEPPGFQLHYDDPADGLVTHAVPVGSFAGPYIYA
jgi:3',5'-cyclic AMP phosphodiesterase CpdA